MIGISLSFSSLLLLVFLVMLAVTTIFSAILVYHWRAYGESAAITTQTMILYFVGIAVVFGGMAAAIGMAF